MVTLQQMFDRKKEVSAQVSTQVRTAGLSFIAISWALLTAHDEPLKTMCLRINRYAELGLAFVGFLILACDLLQYVATVRFVDAAIGRAEKTASQKGLYDADSRAYKANGFFYRSKFRLLIAGTLLLIGIFAALAIPPA